MPIEFTCECGTTAFIPDRFAIEKPRCPLCWKVMIPVQGKPKPWWEDHQESIRRIMGSTESPTEDVERVSDQTEELDEEYDDLTLEVSEERVEIPEGIEPPDGELPSTSESVKQPARRALVPLLGLLALLLGLSVYLFVSRPDWRAELRERVGQLRPKEAAQETPPAAEVQKQATSPGGERTYNPSALYGPHYSVEHEAPVGPSVSVDEAAKSGGEPRMFSPTQETAEPEEAEKGQEKFAELNASPEPDRESSEEGEIYTVSVGSFREKARADRYVEQLKDRGFDAFEREVELADKGTWYRVSIGEFPTLNEARLFAKDLEEKGLETFVARRRTGQVPVDLPDPSVREGSDSTPEDNSPQEIQDVRRLLRL